LAAGLAVAMAASPARAQPTEDAVQAAYIPKFARYVEWPAAFRPAPREPFQLCVIGHDPFGPLLDRAASVEHIEGRSVVVRRLPSAGGSGACHLAFVRGASARETAQLLLAMRSQPVLTITDARAGAARGMIHFILVAGRVRFYVDEQAAAARGLTISSRLLALALAVRQRRT
jgi:hypothetical protein